MPDRFVKLWLEDAAFVFFDSLHKLRDQHALLACRQIAIFPQNLADNTLAICSSNWVPEFLTISSIALFLTECFNV
jgi:hypothetical protein